SCATPPNSLASREANPASSRIVRWYSPIIPGFAIAAAGTDGAGAGASKGAAAVRWKLAVSATGYEASTSEAGALSVAGATGTALSGVPSTGQKLNLSANCSWHVSQNFIVTTSLPLWGLSAEFDIGAGLLIAC